MTRGRVVVHRVWSAHIRTSPPIDAGVGSGGTRVSLAGHAAVVDDVATKKELWNGGLETWLPQGPEDPPSSADARITPAGRRRWTEARRRSQGAPSGQPATYQRRRQIGRAHV